MAKIPKNKFMLKYIFFCFSKCAKSNKVPEEFGLEHVSASPVVSEPGPVVQVGLVLGLVVQGDCSKEAKTLISPQSKSKFSSL